MTDVSVLTMISTLILMVLTLSSFILFQIHLLDSPFLAYEKYRISKIVSIIHKLVSSWSVVAGILWFLYFYFFDNSAFLKCNGSQVFIYLLSLLLDTVLLIFSGFIGFAILRLLPPEVLAINRTKKEVGL